MTASVLLTTGGDAVGVAGLRVNPALDGRTRQHTHGRQFTQEGTGVMPPSGLCLQMSEAEEGLQVSYLGLL